VKDRFGVSWQIVPRQLIRLIGDADRARARRAFDAMMQMKRIDIAAIERAADQCQRKLDMEFAVPRRAAVGKGRVPAPRREIGEPGKMKLL
jgi:hypothetical protein